MTVFQVAVGTFVVVVMAATFYLTNHNSRNWF